MTPALFIATAGGIGHARRAPGTWASIAAGALALGLIPCFPPGLATPITLAIATAFTLLGLMVCPAAVRHFQVGDPQPVVIDEVAGVWWALGLVPGAMLTGATVPVVILAVGLFRVFDIAKPWPVGSLEHLPGPPSIMADDVAAGLLAGLVTVALIS